MAITFFLENTTNRTRSYFFSTELFLKNIKLGKHQKVMKNERANFLKHVFAENF